MRKGAVSPLRRDYTGKRFGKLVGVRFVKRRKNGIMCWLCQCDCGNEVVRHSGYFLSACPTERSCGCVKRARRMLNLEGKRFGKLLVLSFSRIAQGYSIWNTRCDCGTEKEVCGKSMLEGQILACGCNQLQARYVDLRTKFTREELKRTFGSYRAMLVRCGDFDPEGGYYKHYAAKGITVTKRWRQRKTNGNGFRNFITDLGPRPEGTTIDRIDPDWNYCKRNCRWATAQVQALNRGCMREDVEVCKEPDNPYEVAF